jgi:hypothetical protein
MGIDNETRIVLGSLRYKTSPNVPMYVNVPMEQTQKELIEFDRSVDLSLQQVFVDERTNSNIFRPVTKFSIIFKNQYSGSTTYPPFRDNLYYTNAIGNAVLAYPGGNNPLVPPNPLVPWEGFPQYFEFDFIRNDNNNVGYTQPPNNHLTFVNKSASTYNWTHYLSYAYDNVSNRPMQAVDQETSVSWSWVASDGLPFIIKTGNDNQGRVISFRCVMPHGLSVDEFVRLSFDYNGEYIFRVSSLGDTGFGSEEFIFNITNVGYTGPTFNQNVTGTFKRVINRGNTNETTSDYYVRRNKILTSVEDSILVKAGFEQNIFNSKTKSEPAVLTPNNLARTSVKEGGQAYTLSFNNDVDLNGLIDNQKRPLLELYFTTIWKGYFGWTNPLKQGFEFNLPLVNGIPSPWWNVANQYSDANIPTGTYFSPPPLLQGPFTYQQNLNVGDIIDGDYCEYNGYDQTERVISSLNHKFTFNNVIFTLDTIAPQNNQFGYYYKPHNPITIRTLSNYIEEGNAINVVGIPGYAYYSNLSNSFRWRDIYPYGFLDADGIGVDYPFINGKHYPFVNTIFRLIPEGTNTANQYINEIAEPTIDECE